MLISKFLGSRLFEEASEGAGVGGGTSGQPAEVVSSEAPSDARAVSEGSDAFSDLVTDDFRLEPTSAQPQVSVPVAQQPSTPTQVAPGANQLTAQPVVQIPQQPAQISPQQQQVQQPPPQQQYQPQTAEQVQNAQRAQYNAHRAASVAELTRAYSNFTEEQKIALMTAPETVLPGMLAQAQVDAVEYTYRSVMASIPAIIQAQVQHNIQEHAALAAFYSAFPDLQNHPQAQQTIWQIGSAYVQANPQATAQDRIQSIGLLTRARLGLPLQGTQAPQQPALPAQAAPQQQQMPLLPPYTPSGVGGSAAAHSTGPQYPWDDFLHLGRM